MKQATTALRAIEKSSRILFWSMSAAIVLLAFVYVYMVNKTVWNVVARQSAETQIVALNTDLSNTEFQYMTAKNNVTMDLATSMGFVSAQDQTMFVTQEGDGKNVALR